MRAAHVGVAAAICAVISSASVGLPASADEVGSARRTAPHNPAQEPVSYLVDVSAVSGTNAWSVGYRQAESGTTRAKIRHWDGVRWSLDARRQQAGSALTSLDATTATDIWAVGSQTSATGYATLAEHWDGTRWSTVPGPDLSTNASFNSVSAVGQDDVWAVGGQSDGTQTTPLVEHWDGSSWTVVANPKGPTRLTDVSGVGPRAAWAVALNGYVEHWDGRTWAIVDKPHATLLGLNALSARNVWAVGSVTGHTTFAEHWDGSSWAVVTTPNGTGSGNSLQAVQAVRSNDVWAVGYRHLGGLDHTLIEHWDGSAWRISPGPGGRQFSSTLLSVDGVSSRDAWTVGSLGDRSLREQWDGVRWRRVTSP